MLLKVLFNFNFTKNSFKLGFLFFYFFIFCLDFKIYEEKLLGKMNPKSGTKQESTKPRTNK